MAWLDCKKRQEGIEGTNRCKVIPKYKVQLSSYGFATIEAKDWEDAESKASEMSPTEFNVGGYDIDVVDEEDKLTKKEEETK